MRSKNIVSVDNSLLVVIDVQEKLLPSISGHKEMSLNISRLIRGAKVHNVPILCTEQYTKGLGKTVEIIAKEMEGINSIEKMEFSCFQNENFKQKIKTFQKIKNIIICGIEAHVCVLQTCLDGLELGYNVHVVVDAVSSRKNYDFKVAMDKMMACGVLPTTVEIALFELTHKARTPEFKEISIIAKEFTKESKIGFKI